MAASSERSFKVGDWLVEPDLDRITRESQSTSLRPQVMELLVYLARQQGRVAKTEDLLNDLWTGKIVTDGTVYNCVAELRHALDDEDRQTCIETIPKKGYRLIAPVSAIDNEMMSDRRPRSDSVEIAESVADTKSQIRSKRVILAAGTLALFIGVWFFVFRPMLDSSLVGPQDSAKTIAVLPFIAMSSGEDDGYFADGLTGELLNSLARIDDLKVAGSTSSFFYKGKTPNFQEVGEALGVAHVLEGSVRRVGNQLRITVQLIKVDDGFLLWSAPYERSMDDIFDIQEDIANQVAAALKVTLLGEEAEALGRHGTTNAAAQSNYLIASGHIRRGLALWLDASQKNEHLKVARRLLEDAVELDPNFAEAWAMLVPAYWMVAWGGIPDASGEMLTHDEALALAGPAAERAIALAPDLPEAWVAMGLQTGMGILYTKNISNNEPALLQEAEAAYERALSLDPNNPAALEAYARYRLFLGQPAAAVVLLDRAVVLDPLSTIRQLRAQAMYRAGRIDEARREYFEVARLYPDAPYEGGIAEIEFDRGHFHHGLVWLTGFVGSLQPPYAWRSLGDTERALEVIAPYKAAGGAIAEAVELAEYFFLRDYQGLSNASAAATKVEKDRQFLLTSLYYLGRWDDAISMLENWPADHRRPRFPENVTGTGRATDRQYRSIRLGRWATQAAYYAHALASVGRREDAEPVWRWALELGSRIQLTTPGDIQERHHLRLLVFASRGEKEAALSALEAMVDAGWRWLMSPGNMDSSVYSVGLGWFEDSPLLDSIRDEPRARSVAPKLRSDR
ncbi:MAG: winged helix-turn-helix domain-containing protein, partial [Woeseiaceae bacterium]